MKRYEYNYGKNPEGVLSTISGYATETTNYGETAFGILNKSTRDDSNYTTPEVVSSSIATLFSVGNGTDHENRKNIIELKADGTVFISGVGGYDGTNPEDATNIADEFQGIHDDIDDLNDHVDRIDNTIESIHIAKDENSDLIYTLLIDGENRGTINIPKDQFLRNVRYDNDTNELIFSFVTTENDNQEVRVNLTDLEDIYIPGDGINIDNKEVSVKVDADTQPYIIVTANGVKIVGIDEKFNTINQNVADLTNRVTTAENNIDAILDDLEGLVGDGEGSVQDQINKALEDYLPLSGGTMTGNIEFTSGPDANGYEYVDLGLPSGNLWAKCNVGASTEEEGGLHFQWGDILGYTKEQVGRTEGKKYFKSDYSDYKYSNGSIITKYNTTDGLTVLEIEDDGVHAYMGGDWRIPTFEEFKELIDETNVYFVETNGQEIQIGNRYGDISDNKSYFFSWSEDDITENSKGIKFVNKTDPSKYIFIPADGSFEQGYISGVNIITWLWSASAYPSDPRNNWAFYANRSYCGMTADIMRHLGFPLRGILPGHSSGIVFSGKSDQDLVNAAGSTTSISDIVSQVDLSNYVTIDNAVGKLYPDSNHGEIFNDYTNNEASGDYSHAEGFGVKAIGDYSHVEGFSGSGDRGARGVASHVEGNSCVAMGNYSHAEGSNTYTFEEAEASHVEGYHTSAHGKYAHAEGNNNSAHGQSSHSEGNETVASGLNSHAEGYQSQASGLNSHAEGGSNATAAYSHAEGRMTTTKNITEHAEGYINVSNSGATPADKTLHSVGIGGFLSQPANAHEIMQNGDHYIYGIGGYYGTNYSDAQTLQEVISQVDTFVQHGGTIDGPLTIKSGDYSLNITPNAIQSSYSGGSWSINPNGVVFSSIPSGYLLTSGGSMPVSAIISLTQSAIVDSAPETLDTLNELAAALNDDPNFATTITNQIATKVSKEGDSTINGELTANGFAIPNGTANEVLTADGDSNTLKTINGQTLLGEGDIDLSGYATSDTLSGYLKVPTTEETGSASVDNYMPILGSLNNNNTFTGGLYFNPNTSVLKVANTADQLNDYVSISNSGINIAGKTNDDLIAAGGGTVSVDTLATKDDLSGYLPLTGGTMSSSATISIPSDNVEVYINNVDGFNLYGPDSSGFSAQGSSNNGLWTFYTILSDSDGNRMTVAPKGITILGKTTSDLLNAAGGTTTLKTVGGESVLGEGNIETFKASNYSIVDYINNGENDSLAGDDDYQLYTPEMFIGKKHQGGWPVVPPLHGLDEIEDCTPGNIYVTINSDNVATAEYLCAKQDGTTKLILLNRAATNEDIQALFN